MSNGINYFYLTFKSGEADSLVKYIFGDILVRH